MVIKVLKSVGQVKRLEPAWNNLFERDPYATPFQSYSWCMAWWIVFCRSLHVKSLFKLLRVITLEDDAGQVKAILPGYLVFNKLPEFRPLGHMASDYCLPLVSPGCTKEDVRLLLDKASAVGFGRLDILNVPQGHMALDCGLTPVEMPCQSFVKSLGGDPESIVAGTSSNFRSTLKFKLKRSKHFAYEVLTPSNPQFKLRLADFLRLHEKRFEAKGKKSCLNTDFVRFLNLFAELDKHQMSRLLIVLDKDRVIGANLCLSFKTKYQYYNAGIDPEYSQFSLGTVMLYKHMLNAIEEGCTEFDFLRGNEDYKLRWKPDQTIQHYRIKT